MSRATEDQIQTTTAAQNAQQAQNAQNAFTGANDSITQQQGDVGNYEGQLSQFAAANPYGAGGAFQTSTNQVTANTADASSQAAAQAAQAQAVRTGQNASGGVAAGQATNQANTRNLMATQAGANANRIAAGAKYGSQVLSASAVPATLQGAITGEQGTLARTEADAANQAEDTSEKAGAASPSFLDQLDQGIMSAGTAFAGGYGQSVGKGCWIAAELYGGWFEPRTQEVRRWIFGEFSKSVHGFLICSLYTWCGERVAGYIRRWPILRRVFLPIFNAALAKARESRNGR